MSRFIRQLSDDMLICLSSNGYYLNIIEGDETVYRIDSDEKIIYFNELMLNKLIYGEQKGLYQTKRVNKLVMVINRKLQWNIFVISKGKQPIKIFYGKINISNSGYYYYEQGSKSQINSIQVVNIHEVGRRVIILLNDMRIYELIIDEKIRNYIKSILFPQINNNTKNDSNNNNKNDNKKSELLFFKGNNNEILRINSNLIYPLRRQLNNNNLVQQYLPSLQTHQVSNSLIVEVRSQQQINSNNKSNKQYKLFLVFKQKKNYNQLFHKNYNTHYNNTHTNNNYYLNNQLQQISSIYELVIDYDNRIILSGRQCIININYKIIDLYLLTYNNNQFIILIQTINLLYLWNYHLNNNTNNKQSNNNNRNGLQQLILDVNNNNRYRYLSYLTLYNCQIKDNNISNQYIVGVALYNNNNQNNNYNNQNKFNNNQFNNQSKFIKISSNHIINNNIQNNNIQSNNIQNNNIQNNNKSSNKINNNINININNKIIIQNFIILSQQFKNINININNNNVNRSCRPILYYRNRINNEQSYIFNSNYSISKLKFISNNIKNINNIINSKQLGIQVIYEDLSSQITDAKLLFIQPMTNILLINKNTLFNNQHIIITNSYLQTNHNQYQHNLPLYNSKLFIHLSNQQQQYIILLSNPIIGTLSLKINKLSTFNNIKNNNIKNYPNINNNPSNNNNNLNNIYITINDQYKLIAQSQLLTISQSNQLFITPQQIIFSLQPNKLNKLPSITINKLFQSSTDYIDKSIIFHKSQLILLTLDDQLHIFQGNNQKNIKRKYIHCFNNNIKSISKLNDVNVFAIQLYPNHNDTQNDYQSNSYFEIYVLKQDKITLLNKITYNHLFSNIQPFSFLTHINTVPFYFNFIYGQVILVSSQQTHRYNPQKIKIQIHQFPTPILNQSKFQIFPLINLSLQNKNNPDHQFLFLVSDQNNRNSKTYIGSLSKKFLLKSFNEINFNFQPFISQINFNNQNILFSTIQNEIENTSQKKKKLMIFTTKKCYYLSLSSGKLFVSNLQNNSLVEKLFHLNASVDIKKYKGVQKIGGPLKICKKQNSLSIYGTQNINQEQDILIYNKFELWFAKKNDKKKEIHAISVYAMVNNEFLQFRNNLSVDQVDQPEFIKIFSLKLPIVQVKYLSNKQIIVLFEKQIIVLQIGSNNSLTVRQQIVFNKTKQNDQIQQNNEYSSIKIIELLDKASQTDIFLKDAEGRLYLFQYNLRTQKYEIIFNKNLEQDIVCVGRVAKWEEYKAAISLYKKMTNDQNQSGNNNCQQLVVKRDSQILIKDLKTNKQTSQYI